MIDSPTSVVHPASRRVSGKLPKKYILPIRSPRLAKAGTRIRSGDGHLGTTGATCTGAGTKKVFAVSHPPQRAWHLTTYASLSKSIFGLLITNVIPTGGWTGNDKKLLVGNYFLSPGIDTHAHYSGDQVLSDCM